MMKVAEDIKIWRAKAIAKLFLLKSSHKVSIEEPNHSPFNLLVFVENDKTIEFGIIIILSDVSDSGLRKHLKDTYTVDHIDRNEMPVLLMIIDDEQETGKIDYFIAPEGQRLVLREDFHFQVLNIRNLNQYIQEILAWSEKQTKKIA